MVRAKFRCVSKTIMENGSCAVLMQPVMTGSEENKLFYKWTPAGELKLELVNPAVGAQLEPGKNYYLDISPAE